MKKSLSIIRMIKKKEIYKRECKHLYSRNIKQEYPRKCIRCGKTESRQEQIINKCIMYTGIEDGKTCLDTAGAKDLCLDIWEEAYSLGWKEGVEDYIKHLTSGHLFKTKNASSGRFDRR